MRKTAIGCLLSHSGCTVSRQELDDEQPYSAKLGPNSCTFAEILATTSILCSTVMAARCRVYNHACRHSVPLPSQHHNHISTAITFSCLNLISLSLSLFNLLERNLQSPRTNINMQYSAIFLSALFATLALGHPARRSTPDKSIRVQLSGPSELATQTAFEEGHRQVKSPNFSSGPYDTVSLEVGKGVKQQGLRCQVRNEQNKPIVVLRNGNRDITFADGDAGSWTFESGAQNVVAIICDPAFVKGEAPPAAPSATPAAQPPINVRISGLNEFATNIDFLSGGLVREVQRAGGRGIDKFELTLDPAVKKQNLRCKVLDKAGKPITGKRGANVDITFADGGNGPWTFINEKGEPINVDTSLVVCDPAFVKRAA